MRGGGWPGKVTFYLAPEAGRARYRALPGRPGPGDGGGLRTDPLL